MEKYEIKYCRYCGEELKEVDGKKTCDKNLEDPELLKLANDKTGILAYILNNSKDSIKDHVIDKASILSKTFFLTKLLSYVLFVSIVVGTAAVSVGTINKVKNDTLLETGEIPKEENKLNTYDFSIIIDNQESAEIDQNTNEEDDVIIEEQSQEEVERKEVQEIAQQEEKIENSNFIAPDPNAPMIQQKFDLYHQYILGYYDNESIFANGPLTSGAFMSFDTEQDSVIGVVRVEVGNNLFLFYKPVNTNTLEEEDICFAKISFEEVDGDLKIVSDEAVNMSWKEIKETY